VAEYSVVVVFCVLSVERMTVHQVENGFPSTAMPNTLQITSRTLVLPNSLLMRCGGSESSEISLNETKLRKEKAKLREEKKSTHEEKKNTFCAEVVFPSRWIFFLFQEVSAWTSPANTEPYKHKLQLLILSTTFLCIVGVALPVRFLP